MMVFGGVHFQPFLNRSFFNDLHALSLETNTWNRVAAAGTPPSRRFIANTLYDPVPDRLLLIRGGTLFGYSSEVWSLGQSQQVAPLTHRCAGGWRR